MERGDRVASEQAVFKWGSDSDRHCRRALVTALTTCAPFPRWCSVHSQAHLANAREAAVERKKERDGCDDRPDPLPDRRVAARRKALAREAVEAPLPRLAFYFLPPEGSACNMQIGEGLRARSGSNRTVGISQQHLPPSHPVLRHKRLATARAHTPELVDAPGPVARRLFDHELAQAHVAHLRHLAAPATATVVVRDGGGGIAKRGLAEDAGRGAQGEAAERGEHDSENGQGQGSAHQGLALPIEVGKSKVAEDSRALVVVQALVLRVKDLVQGPDRGHAVVVPKGGTAYLLLQAAALTTPIVVPGARLHLADPEAAPVVPAHPEHLLFLEPALFAAGAAPLVLGGQDLWHSVWRVEMVTTREGYVEGELCPVPHRLPAAPHSRS